MFIIYETQNTETNNIRDIFDIVLNITGNEETANKAWTAASEMNIGSLRRFENFEIVCVNDIQDISSRSKQAV